MNSKEFKAMTRKPTKYRAVKTLACPYCWGKAVDMGGKIYACCPMNGCWDSRHKSFGENDLIKFDSHGEQKRGAQLKAMERKGLITDLQRQVRFNLFPKMFKRRMDSGFFYTNVCYDFKWNYSGRWHGLNFGYPYDLASLKKGEYEILEEERFYVADFVYFIDMGTGEARRGEEVIEDFKGHMTRDAKRKIALFEKLYGVKVSIIKEKDLK